MLETVAVVLGLSWLVISLPFAILVGKCISAGQRHEPPTGTAAAAAPVVPQQAVPAGAEQAGQPAATAPHLPAQREPRTAPAAPAV